MPTPHDRDDQLLLAYLEGRAAPQEVGELERRLREDPRIAERLAIQGRLSVMLDSMSRERSRIKEVERVAEGAPALDPVRARLARPRTRRLLGTAADSGAWRLGLAAAAALVVMALMAISVRSGREVGSTVQGKLRPAPEPIAPKVRVERAEERLREIEAEKKKLLAEPGPIEKRADPSAEEARKAALAELEARKRRIEEELRAAVKNEPRKPDPLPIPPMAEPRKTAEATQSSIARAGKVGGEVYLVSGGERKPLDSGQEILTGQGIETRAGASFAEISFPDQTRVELGAETSIKELRSERGKRVVLEKGGIRAEVKPQPRAEPMVFETAHGEAVVLGTSLKILVSPDPKGGTTLEVQEGKVRLKSLLTGKTVEVLSGHFAVAAAGVELSSLPLSAVLYAANFDDGRGPGWAFSSKYPWTIQATLPGGFALTSPQDSRGSRSELTAVLASKVWQNAVVELDVRPDEFSGSILSSFLVFIRWRDPENALWLEYMLDKGSWSAALLQLNGGVLTSLGGAAAPPLQMGRAVRVRIEAKDDEILAMVDGKESARGKTTVLAPGKLALCPMSSRVGFDNIRVTSLRVRPKAER